MKYNTIYVISVLFSFDYKLKQMYKSLLSVFMCTAETVSVEVCAQHRTLSK